MQTTGNENGAADDRNAAVFAFLQGVLAAGPVSVADLEGRARAAGLLGERQMITDAKVFKRAKKKLGLRSIRDGFGRGGGWLWSLPAILTIEPADTPTDLTPKAPAPVIDADHSRPDQCADHADPGSGEGEQGGFIPAGWTRGVLRLYLARAPRDVPEYRWQQLVRDCHGFLTSSDQWAARAAEIGWDAIALFGCSSTRPLDHLRGAGLLWNVAGGKLIRMHTDWAVIAAPDGSERTFHRRSTNTRSALPWDLR
jgi:hypothetical protein